MIAELAHHGFMKGFLVGDSSRGILTVSHLLFANDTLLFCGVDLNQIKTLKALLPCFEVASVNFNKSKLVQVDSVHNIRQMANILECKVTLPLKYLSLSLGFISMGITIWDPIIEKIKHRLAG